MKQLFAQGLINRSIHNLENEPNITGRNVSLPHSEEIEAQLAPRLFRIW